MSTLARLHNFSRLSRAGQGMILYAFAVVCIIRLSLWLLPFRAVRKWVSRAARPTPRRQPLPSTIEFHTVPVQIASRYVPGATCLTQAMAAQILLARAGHAPKLCIGVMKSEGRFKAHAWVECDGRVVMGDVAGRDEFKMLPAL